MYSAFPLVIYVHSSQLRFVVQILFSLLQRSLATMTALCVWFSCGRVPRVRGVEACECMLNFSKRSAMLQQRCCGMLHLQHVTLYMDQGGQLYRRVFAYLCRHVPAIQSTARAGSQVRLATVKPISLLAEILGPRGDGGFVWQSAASAAAPNEFSKGNLAMCRQAT